MLIIVRNVFVLFWKKKKNPKVYFWLNTMEFSLTKKKKKIIKFLDLFFDEHIYLQLVTL